MDIKAAGSKASAYAKEAFSSVLLLWHRAVERAALLRQREYTVRDGIILFVCALVLGAALKTAVAGTLTIGHDDYRLRPAGAAIDIGALQKEMIQRGGSMSLSGGPSGESCSQ